MYNTSAFFFEAIKLRTRPLRSLILENTHVWPHDHYDLIQIFRRNKVTERFKVKGQLFKVGESDQLMDAKL
jgi:hypothetical protein